MKTLTKEQEVKTNYKSFDTCLVFGGIAFLLLVMALSIFSIEEVPTMIKWGSGTGLFTIILTCILMAKKFYKRITYISNRMDDENDF